MNPHVLSPTLSPQQAARDHWDAIVIGAGIAGSMTALQLARRGRKVLLIERRSLPREKVCGACLNLDAIASFRQAGVWDRIEALGGHTLTDYQLRHGRHRAALALPGGHAVSRSSMDTVLASAAVDAGAEYIDGTAATLTDGRGADSFRDVIDKRGNRFRGTLVVAANGFGTLHPPGGEESPVDVAADARVGLAAAWSVEEVGQSGGATLVPGTIYMAVDRVGYVGLVVTEGGRVNLAAAVDRGAVQASSPAAVCDRITGGCGWDLSEPLHRARFLGTAAMTRRRRVAGGHRLLFVGDSSGYVEPFTGEGMAWAAASALAAGSLADQAIDHWHESCPLIWTDNLKMLLGGRQRRCRWISRLLRYPVAARCAIAALSAFPTLGQFAVQSVQQESSSDLLDRCTRDRGADAGGRAA